MEKNFLPNKKALGQVERRRSWGLSLATGRNLYLANQSLDDLGFIIISLHMGQ